MLRRVRAMLPWPLDATEFRMVARERVRLRWKVTCSSLFSATEDRRQETWWEWTLKIQDVHDTTIQQRWDKRSCSTGCVTWIENLHKHFGKGRAVVNGALLSELPSREEWCISSGKSKASWTYGQEQLAAAEEVCQSKDDGYVLQHHCSTISFIRFRILGQAGMLVSFAYHASRQKIEATAYRSLGFQNVSQRVLVKWMLNWLLWWLPR
jgi:hypothetical protein